MHWPSALQPLIIPQSHPERSKLLDLVLTLQKESERLKSRLPTSLADALPRLIRSMNCYYSNLIEGHNTHPVDIERALQQDYSQDQEKRALQREAVAHIEVQSWLDAQLFDRQALFSVALAKEIHSRFIQLLPEALRWVETPDSGERIEVLPGQLRRNDVRIGQHVAPPVQEVPELLARWEKAYAPLSVVEQLLHVAAAHHRWLWIHPFNDGNGRVARLLSHVQFNKLLEAGALWSISRGLARNVDQYKQLLAACDQPRRNDLDGRGHLSQEALIQFTAFILETCALDQVRFMHDLIQPQALSTRIMRWTVE
ncbi:MAG TPA: Fic family protein, partial [Piscirickettsiaceae bacterium]|nr:Fic family protein [Piscirickettsiaceae bacterium]